MRVEIQRIDALEADPAGASRLTTLSALPRVRRNTAP